MEYNGMGSEFKTGIIKSQKNVDAYNQLDVEIRNCVKKGQPTHSIFKAIINTIITIMMILLLLVTIEILLLSFVPGYGYGILNYLKALLIKLG